VNDGKMTHKGKTAVVEDAFASPKTRSSAGTPARSRAQTPAGSAAPSAATSAAPTPAGSGAEDASPANGGGIPLPKIKKKKQTRNQLKAQEERRRLRKLHWLTHGGPKPEDTDED
jgi:elongation factor 3